MPPQTPGAPMTDATDRLRDLIAEAQWPGPQEIDSMPDLVAVAEAARLLVKDCSPFGDDGAIEIVDPGLVSDLRLALARLGVARG